MRAQRKDASQSEIVAAGRAAGFWIHVMDVPVDLLVWNHLRLKWELYECKTKTGKVSGYKRQRDGCSQREFIDRFRVPIVRSAEQFLFALGATREIA